VSKTNNLSLIFTYFLVNRYFLGLQSYELFLNQQEKLRKLYFLFVFHLQKSTFELRPKAVTPDNESTRARQKKKEFLCFVPA